MKHLAVLLFLTFVLGVSGSTSLGFYTSDKQSQYVSDNYFLCPYCKDIIELVNKNIASNKTFHDLRQKAIAICDFVLAPRGIRGYLVCPGLIDSYGPHVIYIATQVALDPETVCQDLNYCPRDLKDLPPRRKFLQHSHNHTTRPTSYRTKPKHRDVNERSTFSVLQITDIHIDPRYTVGTPTDCGIFICCSTEFNGTGSAGTFGDYNCDLPLNTFNIILDSINNIQPKPDFILFTGDFPPHDIWEESWDSQLNRTHDLLIHMSKKLNNFLIYPTLGNHECFPESLYYEPLPEFQKLNSKTAEWWQYLFPIPQEQIDNIRYNLYYTVLVKPGLRILSFNSDYGYTENFYALLNDDTPAYFEQMNFMEKTLSNARENKEKVILIGHVPPGNVGVTNMEYGDFFTDIVSAYSDVIVLTTFGHTHYDHFEVVKNPKSHEAVGVVLIAPSVTTEGRINPSYRVYHFDSKTFELQDYDQYFFNITAANKMGKTTVNRLYSAKSEYNMTDLTPESFLDLSNRFKMNGTLFNQYWDNFHAQNGLNETCDTSCKHSMICRTRSASLRAYLQCMGR